MKTFDYIRQENGSRCCAIIVLLNYIIWETGFSPIEYKSKKFWELIDACGGSKYAEIMDINPALKELRLTLTDVPCFKTLSRFKSFLISKLKKRQAISFCLRHRQAHNHYILITSYDEFYESFLVFNSGILCNHIVDEVSWEDLTKRLFVPEKYRGQAPYYNESEGTGMIAKYCIERTKIIGKASDFIIPVQDSINPLKDFNP